MSLSQPREIKVSGQVFEHAPVPGAGNPISNRHGVGANMAGVSSQLGFSRKCAILKNIKITYRVDA
ncbi:hypothetical protein D1AOALGA4SA_3025 [Olavius algarvensis Delta 1 endosymbiont]|nr:hypothetical protein D1AOALGA4SA_3025 [Olavius algarvensis Delta 1 endosymbiont]